MALVDVLRNIVDRLNFAGDDGAKESLLSEIDDLDDGGTAFGSGVIGSDAGADDGGSDSADDPDGANA